MPSSTGSDVTRLLVAWHRGDVGALDRLMPVVYDELRRVARRHLRNQKSDATLQTTALVHEAYLRLADSHHVSWENRAQFFAFSAQVMRRVLVDIVRARNSQKRGGGTPRVSLDTGEGDADIPDVQRPGVLAVDDALQSLAVLDPRKASVVELRYFGGLTVDETSEALQISRATVEREWQMARLWLSRELKGKKR